MGTPAAGDDPGDLPSRLRRLAGLPWLDADLPDPGGTVVFIETHLSHVLLRGPLALKLKKPVRTAFQDLRSPQARQRNALEELRLNRRLAPEVYLDVLVLRRHEDAFELVSCRKRGAEEGAIEWLVLMRRLPSGRMLDRCIAEGLWRPADMDALAARLARFYAGAPRAPVTPTQYVDRLQADLARHAAVLSQSEFADLHARAVVDEVSAALERLVPRLQARVRSGHVVEGHGDLRPEHVCLLDPPVVIDCLEFDAALRQVDPLEELALLALECELLGDVRPALQVRDGCLSALDGEWSAAPLAAAFAQGPLSALWSLHLARAAVSRARFALAHLLDPVVRTPQVWRPRTAACLALARREVQTLLP